MLFVRGLVPMPYHWQFDMCFLIENLRENISLKFFLNFFIKSEQRNNFNAYHCGGRTKAFLAGLRRSASSKDHKMRNTHIPAEIRGTNHSPNLDHVTR